MTIEYLPTPGEASPIILPADGDSANQELFNVPYRQIADRTERAFERLDGVDATLAGHTAELADHATIRDMLWNDGGDLAYQTPKLRVRVLNPVNARPLSTAWSISALTWSCNTANASIYFPINLPHMAQIQRVRVAVQKGHANEDIGFWLLRYGPQGFTVAAFTPPSVDQIITGTMTGSAGDRIFTFDTGDGFDTTHLYNRPSPHGEKATVAPEFSYALQVFTGSAKTVADKVYGVQVVFLDPGPGGR